MSARSLRATNCTTRDSSSTNHPRPCASTGWGLMGGGLLARRADRGPRGVFITSANRKGENQTNGAGTKVRDPIGRAGELHIRFIAQRAEALPLLAATVIVHVL